MAEALQILPSLRPNALQLLYKVHQGGEILMQELMGIAEANTGLEVATTKCLDRCKQGPCLEVSTAVAGTQVCVSKEKPPKKQKMLRKLMAF